MKRVYVAIALLLAVAVGCIVSIWLENKHLTDMIKATEQMERYCLEDNVEQAERLALDLRDGFSKKTQTFALFLHHSVLQDIEESLAVLPYYLRCGEIDHFLTETARCRLLLQTQLKTELPTWENIL